MKQEYTCAPMPLTSKEYPGQTIVKTTKLIATLKSLFYNAFVSSNTTRSLRSTTVLFSESKLAFRNQNSMTGHRAALESGINFLQLAARTI